MLFYIYLGIYSHFSQASTKYLGKVDFSAMKEGGGEELLARRPTGCIMAGHKKAGLGPAFEE